MEIANLTKEQKEQQMEMYNFLVFLNRYSNQYILKGGTALMFAYGLNRFSEDIDLDSTNKEKIKELVEKYSKIYKTPINIKKETDTVFRVMLKYNEKKDPLKVEVSFRKTFIPEDSYKKISGMMVYNIDHLANMKAMAYLDRNRLRDLFDVTFIVNKYYEQLSSLARSGLISAFQHKGLEHFDYITSQQSDPLIDPKVLEDSFLKAYDKLGLFMDKYEPEQDLDLEPAPKKSTSKKNINIETSSKKSICDS